MMKNARGVLYGSLTFLLGIYSWDISCVYGQHPLPDCGQELCVKGYEICVESRCRNCADFLGTDYGCHNIETQQKCSSFCIDEVERTLNNTIQVLQSRLSSPTSYEDRHPSLPVAIVVLIAVLIFVVGIFGGVGGILLTRRLRAFKNQSNTSSEESLDPESRSNDTLSFKDPRLSQIPPNDDSQRLIAQETGT